MTHHYHHYHQHNHSYYYHEDPTIQHVHLHRHHRNLWREKKVNSKNMVEYHHDVFHTHYHRHHYPIEINTNTKPRHTNTHLDIYHCRGGKPFWYKKNSRHHQYRLYYHLVNQTHTKNTKVLESTVDDHHYPNNFSLGPFTDVIKKEYQLFQNSSRMCAKAEFRAYDTKHIKINCFMRIWKIYLSVNSQLQEKMKSDILPYFLAINWTTMSRLYDPKDHKFIEMFGDRLDYQFAQRYHPYFTNLS